MSRLLNRKQRKQRVKLVSKYTNPNNQEITGTTRKMRTHRLLIDGPLIDSLKSHLEEAQP